jgi:2,3-bisphosphoglycerate-dependent phosphoglycerate mutase
LAKNSRHVSAAPLITRSPQTTIYLVRHAHAHWSADEQRPLSDAGTSAASRVAALLSDRPIVAIYSSPSRRAFDTIAPLAERRRLACVVVHDLREREFPPVAAAAFDRAMQESWRQPNRAVPGAETNAAAAARGLAVLGDLRATHAGQQIAVSTHGTLLALMVNGLDSTRGFEFWRSLSFPDVYQLDFTADQLVRLDRLWPGT